MTESAGNGNERMVTAYHEAGHTIAAVVLNIAYEYVTLRVGDKSLGRFERGKGTDLPDPVSNPTAEHLDKVERRIMYMLAGYVAEEKKTRELGWIGGSDEPQEAAELLACHVHDEKELQSRWVDIQRRVTQLIESHWKQVEAVAAALLKEETLTAKRVSEVLNAVNATGD